VAEHSTRHAAAALVLAIVATAAPLAAREEGTLVVGSKNFTENRILAHMIAQLVDERTDVPVELRDGLGGTLFVFEALRGGDVDVYPEYTGTGWAVVLAEDEPAPDPRRTFLHVAREYEERFGIRWLAPFGFANSYALAVRTDVAERLGLWRVSDLVPHAPDLTAGVSHEFLSRDDGWPGVSRAYGLEFGELRGMEHGLAFEAIDASEIDVIDAWTTDGKLLRFDVRVLRDDRRFWPPYHCAPIARVEALERWPELETVLGDLALVLPDERMQELNARVEVEGYSFAEAARTFLETEGLLEARSAERADASGAGERRGDLMTFLRGRVEVTGELMLEHLALTLGAVLGAVLLAVPVGIWLTRHPHASGFVLGAAGIVQTVPSLAMLAFMIPLLGLGVDAAYAALFLYALLPILRNTTTGILEVDANLVEAATGMGLTPGQILLRVELPLATRTIMAGIRTATVITIGVTTLAAFIGAGGLGEPIVTGLQLNEPRLVLAGAVPAALLAILVDALLGRLERRLIAGPRA